ncbi:Polyprotein [Phytophthora palmivora]|uniref:Polyprotein n=1 Tax=Phytophthora palmivora TaxID=4796 RepID=A0A2P4XVE4_9STRA|nr:Polyprotein [Phytophthora palmivora]
MRCSATLVWRSKFQKRATLSSTEFECMGRSEYIKEVVWMRRLLKDLGAEKKLRDNEESWYQSRIKRIDIRYNFVREKVNSGEVEIVFEQPKNQLADFLTKILSSKTLRYLMVCSNIGTKFGTSN